MLKVLLSLALCCNFLFAYFVVEDDYKRQIEVLKDLDIVPRAGNGGKAAFQVD